MSSPFRRWQRHISSILALLSVLACTTATFVIQQYDGAQRPAESVAILRIQGGAEVIIAELDGEVLDYRVEERTDRVHIEMLPGEHEVGVAQHPLGRVAYLRFEAEPGRVYQAYIVHNRLVRGASAPETWSAAVFELDQESGDPVRDVSRQPGVPALSPPPPAAEQSPPPVPSVNATATPDEPSNEPAPQSEPAAGSAPDAVSTGALPSSTAPSGPAPTGPAPSAAPAPSGPPNSAPAPPAPAQPTSPPPHTAPGSGAPQTKKPQPAPTPSVPPSPRPPEPPKPPPAPTPPPPAPTNPPPPAPTNPPAPTPVPSR